MVWAISLGFALVSILAVGAWQDCKINRAGYDYKGQIAVTENGKECQRWDATSPHNPADRYKKDGLFVDGSVSAAENYCRNPGKDETAGPWCYTTDPGTRWEWCDIPICTSTNCVIEPLGLGYIGTKSVTVDGIECQAWAEQSPHGHGNGADSKFPQDGSAAAAENFCRNPDHYPEGLWCYTVDPGTRWQLCDVPECGELAAEMSDTAFSFSIGNVNYVLETMNTHVARDGESYCRGQDMTLAPVGDEDIVNEISRQLTGLVEAGNPITEVAVGARSAVNLDKDVTLGDFNVAGWSCVTFVPGDDGNFKMVSKKCSGERSILCSDAPSC